MKIGERLECIAKLVPCEAKVIDVGTDHAYLPVYLVKNKIVQKAIASDIVEGPCNAAKNTVRHYGLDENIEVRKGSGLKTINSGEVNVAIIAGMGGTTIISILTESFEIAKKMNRIILQPMNGSNKLRQWLVQNKWVIIDEEIVLENKKIYNIIVVERGENSPLTEIQSIVGPVILESNHFLKEKYLNNLIEKYKYLVIALEKSETAKNSEKYLRTKNILKKLEVIHNDCECSKNL